jgi:hypothetical protein
MHEYCRGQPVVISQCSTAVSIILQHVWHRLHCTSSRRERSFRRSEFHKQTMHTTYLTTILLQGTTRRRNGFGGRRRWLLSWLRDYSEYSVLRVLYSTLLYCSLLLGVVRGEAFLATDSTHSNCTVLFCTVDYCNCGNSTHCNLTSCADHGTPAPGFTQPS